MINSRSCSFLPVLLLLLAPPAAALGGVVAFDNSAPVVDVNGQQVDAHDGMVVQFDKPHGLYYRYAIEYGLYTEVGHLRSNGGGCLDHCSTCGGFRFDHNVSVWTSPTLANGSWTLVTREALPIKTRPVASYYRPKVVFNPATGLYVLWVNYAPGGYGNNGHYLSATSATPQGPFAIAVVDVPMDPWVGNHGDFDLFRDSDGRAYVLYTCYCGPGGSHGGTTVSVVELTPDFLNATTNRSTPLANGAGTNAPVFAESPALFNNESAGFYYALITHVCCFCRQGGGVSVFTAAHPLGPFSAVAYDIGCANRSSDVDGCSSSVGEFNVPACGGQGYSWSGAQQNSVFAASTAEGTLLIWTGDRWYSSSDAMKGHDLQHWAPLAWLPPDPGAPFPTAPVLDFIGDPLRWNFSSPPPARQQPQDAPTVVSADWSAAGALRANKVLPTLQVVTNPLLMRASPIHDQAFAALRALGAQLVRFVPWMPYPRLVVNEFDRESGDKLCGFAAFPSGRAVTLNCTAGATTGDGGVITSVDFAAYGSSGGFCGNLTYGACYLKNSTAIVEAACLGKRACTVVSSDAWWGASPGCEGGPNMMAVQVTCSDPTARHVYWDSKASDEIIEDFMAALGVAADGSEANTSVVINYSTAPTYLYDVPPHLRYRTPVPDSLFDTDLDYQQGWCVPLVDASCVEFGRYYGRVLAHLTQGGHADQYGRFVPSPYKFNITACKCPPLPPPPLVANVRPSPLIRQRLQPNQPNRALQGRASTSSSTT